MKVFSIKEAWDEANRIFPTDYQLSELSSQRAGYPVYRSNVNFYDTINDLGDRLEVNVGGKSTNIWIEMDRVEKALAKLGFHKNQNGVYVMA